VTARLRKRAPTILGAALAAAALLVAISVVRVPEGSVGLTRGGRVLPAGWRARAPLGPVAIVPLAGRLEAVDSIRRTPEGAALFVRLSLDYRLDPAAARGAAAALRRRGVAGLAADAAARALEPLPPAVLLPPDLPAAPGGRAPLPEPALQAVARALRAAGLEPSGLEGRIGPRGAFAPASDGGPAVAAGGGPGAGGGPMPERLATGLRILLVGLDGADWDVLDPLLRAGRLPRLARLVAGGARGPLRSYDPMISPLLWTTMVTGVGPDVHGVADFQAVDAATGRRVPITSRFRRVKSLWNILSDAGADSAFVAWWASYPAEPVRGVQVSNLVAFDALRPKPAGAAAPAGLAFPADYLDGVRPRLRTAADVAYDEVRALLKVDRAEFEAARRDVLEVPAGDEEKENRRLAQKPVSLAISILVGSDNYATIGADLAARRYDLTGVYFEGIDMMGHRFQHCMPPRMAICADADFARYRDAVTAFYVRQDALLGRVLDAAGSGTTVMVVSDHGFKSGSGRPPDILPYTTQQPVEWHDEDGVFILSGPGARAGARLYRRATLFDIAPTLLYLLGLPAAEEMPGRVLTEAIDPALLARLPLRAVRSYEPLGAPRTLVAAAAGAEEAEAELLAGLRALGYIGGDDGNAAASRPPADGAGPPGAAPGPGGAAGGREPAGAAESGPGAGTQVFYHRNLATYFLKRKDYARAAEQLRLANERQRLGKNYQLLAEAYAGLGRPREALAALEEGLRDLDTMDPESVLWAVRLALAGTGGRQAAEEFARRHAARTRARPGLDEAIAALLLEDTGDRQGSEALYRAALRADPARVVVAQRLYDLLPPAGRAALLEPAIRKALAKDPRIDEYHNLLGALLAGRGRTAEALESFRRAEALDPQNPRFVANLASALAQSGRWEEAAAVYERAAALQPSAAIYLKVGSVYRRLERPRDALTAFERARAIGGDEPAPWLGIALARAEMRQFDAALRAAREGLDRHPSDAGLRSLYQDLLRRTRSPGSAPGPPG
jgi:tetratricopeptide (TPR) repeat protein